MKLDRADVATACIFLAISAFFAIYSLQTLSMGTLREMGPGFFPLALSVIIAVLACIILLRSLQNGQAAIGAWAIRGSVFILATPLIFAALIRPAGLVPTVILISVVAGYASQKMTLKTAFLLALILSAFCGIVFIWALDMSLPLFPPALMR